MDLRFPIFGAIPSTIGGSGEFKDSAIFVMHDIVDVFLDFIFNFVFGINQKAFFPGLFKHPIKGDVGEAGFGVASSDVGVDAAEPELLEAFLVSFGFRKGFPNLAYSTDWDISRLWNL